MKDDQLYVLDGDDKRELDELRRKVRSLVITREGPTRPVRPVEDTSAWHTWVKLFSSATVGGYYPGTLATYDTIAKAYVDSDTPDTVWVADSKGLSLRPNVYYWCRLEGDLTTTVDTRALYLHQADEVVHAARLSTLAGSLSQALTFSAGDWNGRVSYSTLEYDTDSYWFGSVGNIFVIPSGYGGLYHCEGNVQYTTDHTVGTLLSLYISTGTSMAFPAALDYTPVTPGTSEAKCGLTVSGDLILADGAFIELFARASQDGVTVVGANFSLRRVGPAPAILNTDISGGSGSGSGSGGGGVITSMGKGSATSGAAAVASLTLSSVSIAAGTLLVVNVGVGDSAFAPTATFDGAPMNLAAAEAFGIALTGRTAVFYLEVTTATTGSIVATMGIGTAFMMLSAVEVAGLASFAVDSAGFASGNVTSPSVSITTTTAATYIQSAIMVGTRGGAADFGTGYGGDFASGGQDVTTTGTNGYGLTEGLKIASATGTFSATLGDTPTAWAAVLVAFK